MRSSALLASAERQKKWDRSAGGGMTYGERTIEKAISMLKEVYSPEQEDSSFSPKWQFFWNAFVLDFVYKICYKFT